MTSEETRLRELLNRHTPDPPRLLRIADIERRTDTVARPPWRARRARQAWLPLAAAAVVVLVAAALTLLARTGSQPQPAGPPNHSTPTATPTPTTTATPPAPTPTAPAIGDTVGPWNSVLVARGDFLLGSMTSDGTSLYALTGRTVERVDPGAGVHATAPYTGQAIAPVITTPDHHLWVASFAEPANTVLLQRYSTPALTPAGTLSLPFPSMNGLAPAMTASPDGTRLYVGGGTSVAVIDPVALRMINRITTPHGSVTGLAASPDGATLFVGSDSGGGAQGVVDVYDIATATFTDTAPGAGGQGTLTATAGGLWEVGGAGHSNPVVFRPTNNPSPVTEPGSGGGLYPTVTIADGIAWIGGLELSCADPNTGHVRANATFRDSKGNLTATIAGITATANGTLYGVYERLNHGQYTAIVRIHPPAKCNA